MDKKIIISKLADAIENSKGDDGRNQYLLERFQQNKKIINSDRLYLEKLFGIEILEIENSSIKKEQKPSKKDKSVFLNPNMVKCKTCQKEIKLEEKSSRNENGLFETQYLIPENSKRETLILTIDAENESSATSKILQVFSLGRIPSGSSNVVP